MFGEVPGYVSVIICVGVYTIAINAVKTIASCVKWAYKRFDARRRRVNDEEI